MKKSEWIVALAMCCVSANSLMADEAKGVFRLGMIGLDTSHVVAFTRMINDPKKNTGFRVVAGYPGGSADIPASADRVGKFTQQLRDQYGLEIVNSISELCDKVDGVLLESVDGRPHLEQVKPVIAAKKPVFIDKPMAASLSDVLAIFRLARDHNVPCWSSSSLRFDTGIAGVRNRPELGEILGCDTHGPCSLEPHHPDLYWYGVHGVEALFTIMGPGCRVIQRVQTDDTEFVVGVWKDGRIGTYRGLRSGKKDFGALIYGTKGIVTAERESGYEGLVNEILKFFKTGKTPVSAEETIEIFAFMTAADESKRLGGRAVTLKSVIDKAKSQVQRVNTALK